jgi:hypothetical protein
MLDVNKRERQRNLTTNRPQQRKRLAALHPLHPSLNPSETLPHQVPSSLSLLLPNPLLVARRRSSTLPLPFSRSSKLNFEQEKRKPLVSKPKNARDSRMKKRWKLKKERLEKRPEQPRSKRKRKRLSS